MNSFHVVCFDLTGRIRAISRPHDWVTALQKCRLVTGLGLKADVFPSSAALRSQRAEIDRGALTAPPIDCQWPADDHVYELTDEGWELNDDQGGRP